MFGWLKGRFERYEGEEDPPRPVMIWLYNPNPRLVRLGTWSLGHKLVIQTLEPCQEVMMVHFPELKAWVEEGVAKLVVVIVPDDPSTPRDERWLVEVGTKPKEIKLPSAFAPEDAKPLNPKL